MASSSASERSATTPELRHLRAQQVILVFSNQGMGNLTNAYIIAICMAFFKQDGTKAQMTPWGSAQVLLLMYGFGALACIVMVFYRFIFLGESQVSAMMFWFALVLHITRFITRSSFIQRHLLPFLLLSVCRCL